MHPEPASLDRGKHVLCRKALALPQSREGEITDCFAKEYNKVVADGKPNSGSPPEGRENIARFHAGKQIGKAYKATAFLQQRTGEVPKSKKPARSS